MTFDDLPLFATDAELGVAILGRKRGGEWPGIAAFYEGKGLPPVDPLFGARYRPAVKKFFDVLWNIEAPGVMPMPDGKDKVEIWQSRAPTILRRRQA